MRCTVIYGSPRKNGNTISLTKIFMDELKKKGVMIDFYDVYEKNINGCQVCLGCQSDKSTAFCTIQDDMIPILKSMSMADLIVFASPIYAWSTPAPVKAAIDRSIYAFCKYYGDDPHGPSLLSGKKLALITTCGYPTDRGADLYEEMMRRYSKHCKMDYIGMIAERHRNLKEPFMDKEKEQNAVDFANDLYDLIDIC